MTAPEPDFGALGYGPDEFAVTAPEPVPAAPAIVHYLADDMDMPACGMRGDGTTLATSDPREVTCADCTVSHGFDSAEWEAWLEARRTAVPPLHNIPAEALARARRALPVAAPHALKAALLAAAPSIRAAALAEAGECARNAVAEARADEREACARFVLSDEAVSAAANASDEWFGKDGDLKFGLSETSKAQARVELAVVADLIRARQP